VLFLASQSAQLCDQLERGTEIETAVADYSGNIVARCDASLADVVAIDATVPEQWSVNLPIFADEDSPSELTL